MIFGEMDEEEKALLEEKIIEVYKIKNITFDDKSLFNKNRKFKNEKQMPILEDLYNILGKDKKTQKFKIKLIPFVQGSMKFFNNYTNVEILFLNKYKNIDISIIERISTLNNIT